MENINKKLDEHDTRICKLENNNVGFERYMAKMDMRYEILEKAISKKAEFWDKVKVSITTSVILFFIMWILNRSGIFV